MTGVWQINYIWMIGGRNVSGGIVADKVQMDDS
jgi:hypothetical protein